MGGALLEDWRKLWVKYNLDSCVGPPAQGTEHTFPVFTPSYQDEEYLEISGIIDIRLNGHV